MFTTLVTAAAEHPVTLDEVKDYLRIDRDDTDVDDLVSVLITSAVDHIRDETGRALIAETWDLVFDSWEDLIWEDRFSLVPRTFPFGLCLSVESLSYLNEDKERITVDSTAYEVKGLGSSRACIVFHSEGDFDFPSLYEVDPVTVRIISGYGEDASDVPEQIKTAIKVYVGDLYDGTDSKKTISALLKPYKMVSF